MRVERVEAAIKKHANKFQQMEDDQTMENDAW